jgi:hypothetical protein
MDRRASTADAIASLRATSHRSRRHRRGVSLGAALAAVLLCAAAAIVQARPSEAAAKPKNLVCGGLVPDADYVDDAAGLGVEHACEHLKGRQYSPPASSGATAQAEAAAEAALVSTDPSVVGQWSAAKNPGTKTIGISAVMLQTGKVLLFGGKYKATDKNTAAYLYDPTTGTGHEVPAPAPVFCGSVTPLADGRVLSVGGTDVIPHGIVDLWLFDPVSEQWIRQPDTPLGRYYPTATKMADGRVVIAAGTEVDGVTPNPTVEVYTPPPPGQTMGTVSVVGANHVTAYYPHQWAMPDGNLLQVDNRTDFKFSLATTLWTSLPLLTLKSGSGSAGIILPGGPGGSTRVMVTGGEVITTGQTETQTFDFANPSAGWTVQQPLPNPRAHLNVVEVPDGTAFAIGGNSSDLYDGGQQQTLLYNPTAGTWTPMAVQSVRRAYHSTAVLLPDGRIMSAGDTGAGGGRQLIDFYSPPYLFKGPRPTITSAPTQLTYGATFNIATSGPAVTRAVLMAPGATTHAVEMNARHVELAVTAGPGGLSAMAPVANVAPPGYYMLFALTATGIPSVATWVHIG